MNAPGAIVLVALALSLTIGCASSPLSAITQSVSEPEPGNPFSSVFPESQAGLEVQWWTVTNRGDALAQALAPYASEPTPLPTRVRASWRRNGMRMVRIPVEDVQALLTSLPIENKVNRIWLGQSPGWTVAAPGAPWTGHRLLLIDGEMIRLGAGQLRLLVRTWISPTEGSPTLRTDLALQHLDTSLSSSSRTPFEDPMLRRPEVDGLIFRSLTAPMELSGEYAYCIVAEDPDVDWGDLVSGEQSEIRGGDAPARSGVTPTLPERAPDPFAAFEQPESEPALGPKPAGVPLLADALLSKIELLPTRRRSRTIVILAPVVPDRFSLAPTVPSRPNTPR